MATRNIRDHSELRRVTYQQEKYQPSPQPDRVHTGRVYDGPNIYVLMQRTARFYSISTAVYGCDAIVVQRTAVDYYSDDYNRLGFV